MIGVASFIKRWWYRKFPPLFRLGFGNARTAARDYDMPRLRLISGHDGLRLRPEARRAPSHLLDLNRYQ